MTDDFNRSEGLVMMDKIGIINGKYIDPLTKKIETRNLFLSNGILVGMGVMWDEKEDEFECVDVSQGLIIPQVSTMIDARYSDPITAEVFRKIAVRESVQNAYVMDSRFSDSEYLTNYMETILIDELGVFPLAPLMIGSAAASKADSLENSALSTLKEQGIVGCFCDQIPDDSEAFIQALYIAELLALPVLFHKDCDLERLTAALLQFPKLKMGFLSDDRVTFVHSIEDIAHSQRYVMTMSPDADPSKNVLQTFVSLDPDRPLLEIVWALSYDFRQFFNQSTKLMGIGESIQLTVIDLEDDTFGGSKLSCFQNKVTVF